jgi:hypothetical protein
MRGAGAAARPAAAAAAGAGAGARTVRPSTRGSARVVFRRCSHGRLRPACACRRWQWVAPATSAAAATTFAAFTADGSGASLRRGRGAVAWVPLLPAAAAQLPKVCPPCTTPGPGAGAGAVGGSPGLGEHIGSLRWAAGCRWPSLPSSPPPPLPPRLDGGWEGYLRGRLGGGGYAALQG